MSDFVALTIEDAHYLSESIIYMKNLKSAPLKDFDEREYHKRLNFLRTHASSFGLEPLLNDAEGIVRRHNSYRQNSS